MEVPGLIRVAIIGLMILVPVFFIYKRAGFNPAWSFIGFCARCSVYLLFFCNWH